MKKSQNAATTAGRRKGILEESNCQITVSFPFQFLLVGVVYAFRLVVAREGRRKCNAKKVKIVAAMENGNSRPMTSSPASARSASSAANE